MDVADILSAADSHQTRKRKRSFASPSNCDIAYGYHNGSARAIR
jgi:hypothetical protein